MKDFQKKLPTFLGILIFICFLLYKIIEISGWHYLWWFDRINPTKLFSYYQSLDQVQKIKIMDIYSCKVFINHSLNFQKQVDIYRSENDLSNFLKDGSSLRSWWEPLESSLKSSFSNLSAEWAGCIKKYRDLYIPVNKQEEFNKKFSWE